MSEGERRPPQRTVFRPSPLQQAMAERSAQPAGQEGYVASPAAPTTDDVPPPGTLYDPANPLTNEAAPLLSLLAGLRAGRVRMPLPELHAKAAADIADFQTRFTGFLTAEQLRRAVYAMAATTDDVALNLPGHEGDAAEWAQRSLVVRFFHEAIGGDRFWRLLDEMIAQPVENRDLLALYHACMAAGFEGRYRVAADGRQAHNGLMLRVHQVLGAASQVSRTELSPHWRGADQPASAPGIWGPLILVGAVALTVLLMAYVGFRVALATQGRPAMAALQTFTRAGPFTLDRQQTVMVPEAGAQAGRIRTFLAPERAQGLVEVIEDPATVRVRTTVGQLFDPGSDQLRPEQMALFDRIAMALDTEPGAIRVVGFTDSTPPRRLAFADNFALSKARAEMAAGLVRKRLRDPGRVVVEGAGDSQPVASNDTPEGRSQNRRVEVIVERRD